MVHRTTESASAPIGQDDKEDVSPPVPHPVDNLSDVFEPLRPEQFKRGYYGPPLRFKAE